VLLGGKKMIEINNLSKVYKLSKKQMQEQKTKKNMKKAADGISLKATKGEIYGLLGPNGAGKTTTLRCVATLLKPTEGNISVCGYDTVKAGEEVRKRIGFLTNEIKLDPQFSPQYMFHFFGKLHGISENVINERQEKLFSYFGIQDFKDKKIEELSTGMKQKAAIAVSLVHDPEVIIFDEPTSGLDIVTARSVTDYLKQLKEEGKLVIISTHIMSEAEKLCDRIGVIINGKKVSEGTLAEILEETHTSDLEDAFFELYKVHNVEED
jgi:sodium transport system ATP-binding protein